MPADSEDPLLGTLRKISSQLDDVVQRLESIEQLARPQGATVGEDLGDARTRIARERTDSAGEQEHAIDAVRRSFSEQDAVAE
jgi:hypothetical protein